MKKWLCLMQCLASFSSAMNATTIEMAESAMPSVLRDKLSSCTYLVEGNTTCTESSCWFIDPYNNVRIRLLDETLSSDDNTLMLLKSDIIEIADILKSSWTRHGCYIHFPDTQKNIKSSAFSEDFKAYDWNSKIHEMTYLFDNDRGIPSLTSAFLTGSILIMRLPPDNPVYEVLFIDEPEKMHLTIPAGHVDPGELVEDAVVREALEETGLHLDVENIKLCHLRNSTGLGNGEQNHVDSTFYTFVPYDTDINVDGHEVLNYVWVPVDDLEGTYFGKQISPLYKTIIHSTREIGSPYPSSPASKGRKSLIAVSKIPKKKNTIASDTYISSISSIFMYLDQSECSETEIIGHAIPLSIPDQFKDASPPMGMRRSRSDGYFIPTSKISRLFRMSMFYGLNPPVN